MDAINLFMYCVFLLFYSMINFTHIQILYCYLYCQFLQKKCSDINASLLSLLFFLLYIIFMLSHILIVYVCFCGILKQRFSSACNFKLQSLFLYLFILYKTSEYTDVLLKIKYKNLNALKICITFQQFFSSFFFCYTVFQNCIFYTFCCKNIHL